MDLFVEVRQVVAAGPFLNLLRLTIWTAVAIAIALVQPPLVLALELVVQGDSIDARTPLGELLGLPQVGVEDLRVVLDFTGLDEARIELLRLTTLALTVRVQQVATPIGQHDDMVSMTIEAFRSDESLFAQMAEVAGPRIGRAVVVPTQVARGHDAEGADRCERAALRASQRVFAVPCIVDDRAVAATGQMNAAHEHLTRIVTPISRVMIALSPSCVRAVARVIAVTVIRPWATPESPRVVIAIAVVVAEILLMALVIAVVVTITVAGFVVVVSRVVAPTRIVKHRKLQLPQG